MRRITVYFICLFMMLGNIKFVSADTKINRIMNNKNQDVLFVGSVTYVSDNYFVLSAKDYINTESTSEAIAKRTEDHRYVIMKNENIKYTSSYHEKTTVEEGDHVIASLKKTKGKWTISNGLYETDSDDYQTLSVKAYNKNPDVQSIMLKYFVNTDGMMKKFSCNTDGSKVYYQSKKIYDARWNMKKYLTIEDEFIKLGQALKLAGLVGSGVEAKVVIQDGEVKVNGEVDVRRGRKLHPGDCFEFEGNEVKKGDHFVICSDQKEVTFDGDMEVMIATL